MSRPLRILLLSRYDRVGASSRVRSYQYLPYLAAEGIQVQPAPLFSGNYLSGLYGYRGRGLRNVLTAYIRRLLCLVSSRRFDLLWVEKEIFPWLPASFEFILTGSRVPYVVDYDDAVFHRYDLHPNPFVRRILGQKIDYIMRKARVVIAGSDYLVERALRAGAVRVEYLPSVVDLERYSFDGCPNRHGFTVGWIGSPITAKYLKLVLPALKKIAKTGPLRVILIGSGNVDMGDLNPEIRPWSEETEVRDLQDLDVGIMPLPDGPWERGKCGYKLVQYMAVGRPVVASAVGSNTQIVEHGVTGFLARTISEWVDALDALRRDHTLRLRMGIAGRRKVEGHYSLQVTAPRLASLLRSAVF